MLLLFASLTFLVAHLAFFSDLFGVLHSGLSAGIGVVLAKYAAAAVLVALFMRLAKVTERLSRPLRGRGFLWCGTVLFTLQVIISYGGMLVYRPGLGMLMIPLTYLTPIAAVLALIGSLLAMLGPENAKRVLSET